MFVLLNEGMRVRICFLVVGLTILCSGCDNEPNVLRIGTSTFDENYGVAMVDTMTVAASTVLLDSIPTSNSGSLLVGGYRDSNLGSLQAEAYLQVGVGVAWEPADEARFDSLVFVAKYSGYNYGDTTQAQDLIVQRITSDFKTYNLPQFWIDERQYSALYQAGSLYNSSSVRSDNSSLGSKTLVLRPNSSDSLTIRIDDYLGQQWLDLARGKSDSITSLLTFLSHFKGLAISNVTPQPASVVGLETASIKLRLYYSQFSGDVFKQQVHEFPFSDGLYNYTKILSDRSGTSLEDLTRNKEIPSAETNGESFVQAGTGIVTKLTFPYIRKMIDLKEILLVNQAQLIIEPVSDSYDHSFPLPRNLTLYETDQTNLPVRQLTADYNPAEGQTAAISFDPEFGTTTGYTFAITEYAQRLLSTEGNLDTGLLIMPPRDEINSTVSKALLGAGTGERYRVKLKVWYTTKQ